MSTANLVLTVAECEFIALTVGVDTRWPTVPTDIYPRAGGPTFRIRFLPFLIERAETRFSRPERFSFEFTESELWLLDSALLSHVRTGKLPDGNPVTDLLEKVWIALRSFHARSTDERLHALNAVLVDESRKEQA